MKFIDLFEDISKECPHTIGWLKQIEPQVIREGCEITIRDTDHQYDSIRIEVRPLNGDYKIARKIEHEIYTHILSHCCKCGSTNGVKTLGIGDCTITTTVCKECAEVLTLRGIGITGPELILIPALKHGNVPPKMKCRLKAQDGHLFYKYSDDVYYRNEKFVISDNGIDERVIMAGVYTGLRDFKGERVYTGDVVLAADKEGRKFWGMIMYGHYWGASERDISPQWNNYCLVHGVGAFPSALRWASKIEVIGNVVSSPLYKGPIPNENDYEIYYSSHNSSELKFSDEK